MAAADLPWPDDERLASRNRDPRPDETLRRARRGRQRRPLRSVWLPLRVPPTPRCRPHAPLLGLADPPLGCLGHKGGVKTTLIRCLLGLPRADPGAMALLGHPLPA